MTGRHGHAQAQWAATCETTGKKCYLNRKAARAAGKAIGGGMSAYECLDGDHWHLGHLPRGVVAGNITRDDIRPRKEADQ